jgi:pSer/pThr/pTyr-binding forkhead associated (FHA) protein
MPAKGQTHMPRLIHKRPDAPDRILTFGEKPLVIGRLLDSDVPVRDSFLSRIHCGISYADGHFTLKDLGSTNGTYRNGARVFECQLASGDKIQVGNTTLLFEIDKTTGDAVLQQTTAFPAAPKVTLGPRPLKPPALKGPPPPAKPAPGAPPPAPGLRKI